MNRFPRKEKKHRWGLKLSRCVYRAVMPKRRGSIYRMRTTGAVHSKRIKNLNRIREICNMNPEQLGEAFLEALGIKFVDERDFPCDQCEDGEMIAGFAQPNGQEPHTCNSCGYTISFP